MSKEYYQFESEKGSIAFLIGMVDYLSDRLSVVCKPEFTLDADIFHIPDNNIMSLNDIVRKRMALYANQEGDKNGRMINRINFNLSYTDCNDVNEYVFSKLTKYSSSSVLKEEINLFMSELQWHLKRPIGIYEPVKLPDNNIGILGEIYFYQGFEYFFIKYDEFVVLIIFGTVE